MFVCFVWIIPILVQTNIFVCWKTLSSCTKKMQKKKFNTILFNAELIKHWTQELFDLKLLKFTMTYVTIWHSWIVCEIMHTVVSRRVLIFIYIFPPIKLAFIMYLLVTDLFIVLQEVITSALLTIVWLDVNNKGYQWFPCVS